MKRSLPCDSNAERFKKSKMDNMPVSATPKKLNIDLSTVFSDVKLQLLKETDKLRLQTKSVGLDITEHLDDVLGELVENVNEYVLELREVIADECANNFIILNDESRPCYDLPDDDEGFVTCKKCLFQWDGNAQHICD